MRGIFPLCGVFMTSQYEIPPHTYRFPYRINMPLLILFWDAKQLGITFVTIASGNIFDFFITSVVVAVVFWFAY
ncbi:plasmid transfer protein, partial [Salmonella enterica]|nr:plasmid transfer protein [Salmonella enterica]